MKPFSSLPASTHALPASVRQLRLLLLGVLAFALFLSLPSLETSTPHAAESNRADHLLASEPFIVVANDLLRAVRSDSSDQPDDNARMQPVLLWLPAAIFQPAFAARAIFVSVLSSLHPLPVSSLPGAPRGPPALPL